MLDYSDKNAVLDAIKARHSCITDGDLCRLMGISRTRLSNYRNTTRMFEDDLCPVIETLLDLPPGLMALEAHSQRSKCPAVAGIFHKMAQQLAAGALCLMLVFNGGFVPEPAQSGQIVRFDNNIHYAHVRHRLRRLIWALFFPLWFISCLLRFLAYFCATSQNDKSSFNGKQSASLREF